MSDVNQNRKNIQEKETDYKAIVSSATMKKLGASINFINNSQTMRHEWKLNRFYSFGKGIVNLDGHLTNPFAWEIISMSIVNGTAGISGSTVFNLQWINASNVLQGNILTSNITFGTSYPSNAHFMKRVTDNVILAGSGLPITNFTFTKRTFFAGERVQLNLIDAMNGATDLAILLHWRPINDTDVT